MIYNSPLKQKIPPHLIVWIIGFVAIALIGGSLTMDLSGMSSADQFVPVNWGCGLRILHTRDHSSALVTAFGASVISTGPPSRERSVTHVWKHDSPPPKRAAPDGLRLRPAR